MIYSVLADSVGAELQEVGDSIKYIGLRGLAMTGVS